MTTKYLEVDSTYRNRERWPLQAYFRAETSRPTHTADPIANSTPVIAWKGGRVNISAVVVTSTTTTMIISAGSLPSEPDYVTNSVVTPPGVGIASYEYLGANEANLKLSSPLQTVLAASTPVVVADPTDLALLRVFVPGSRSAPVNFYVGKLLYDETTGGNALVTSYDNESGTITVATAIPGWAVTDSFSLRSALPAQSGISGVTSTNNTIVGVLSVQPGAFARILPTYTNAAPEGQIRRIIAYEPATSTVTVFPAFTAAPVGLPFEILSYSGPNVSQLTYNGTVQNDCVNSTVKLINLMVPNKVLSVGYGGFPTDYPYLYVKLTPRDSKNINVNCSNNPHAVNTLFRVTNSYVGSAEKYPFVKFSGDSAAVKVRFNVDSDLTFQVTLPNGQTLEYVQSDTTSPAVPNPTLQISALFEIVRDGTFGPTQW